MTMNRSSTIRRMGRPAGRGCLGDRRLRRRREQGHAGQRNQAGGHAPVQMPRRPRRPPPASSWPSTEARRAPCHAAAGRRAPGLVARIALKPAPGPPATRCALREAAAAAGKLAIGAINSLARRRDAKSVEVLLVRMKDPDAEVASAAAAGLGRIGGEGAVKALELSLLPSAPAAVRSPVAGRGLHPRRREVPGRRPGRPGHCLRHGPQGGPASAFACWRPPAGRSWPAARPA